MRFPSIFDDLLPPERVKQFMDLVNQPHLVSSLKDAATRLGWQDAWQPQQFQEAMHQAKRWMETVSERFRNQPTEVKSCINATGEVFSSRWRMTPMSHHALREQSYAMTGYSTGPLFSAKDWLMQHVGAEEVLIVGSVQQALMLLGLHPNARPGWIVAKADCIRLPVVYGGKQSADVPKLLQVGGQSVVEVGAVNACSLSDYHSAMPERSSILMVEPSPRASQSESHAQSEAIRTQTLALAQRAGGLTAELLLTASMLPIPELVAGSVPLLQDRLKSHSDIVIIPGDGLISGPRCGILFGKSKAMAPLQTLAEELGFLADPITVAGLSAAFESLRDEKGWMQTPVGGMLHNGLENLQNRATRLAARLQGASWVKQVSTAVQAIPLGPSPWNQLTLQSAVIHIEPAKGSASQLRDFLANLAHPIAASGDASQVTLVMRTIDPNDDERIGDAFWPEDAL